LYGPLDTNGSVIAASAPLLAPQNASTSQLTNPVPASNEHHDPLQAPMMPV
jgi:hypothetical protein